MLDVPTENMEQAFYDLTQKYGELVYLNTFGQPMIVLGSQEAALDLLDKRSGNYSDRIFSIMGPLTGWTWLFSVLPYGSQWRRTRRLFHEYLNSNATIKHRPIQQLHSRRYLVRMLETPEDFLHHARHLFGASIIRVGYGIDVDTDKSGIDYLGIAEEAMHKFSLTFVPGKFLVETFPILRFLPSWAPGATFKRRAAEWYPSVRRMCDVPWNAAMAAWREGKCMPSMATGLLERLGRAEEPDGLEEEYSKNAIASAYAGGADTTLSTLQTFYLAMASHPEVQARAQAELEAVIGPHRLPTYDDWPDLPYVSAVLKECLRWRPVVPLSLTHLSVHEDEYRGYRIPARTAIVNSPWAYARDPKIYHDPETFNPERFLKDGKIDRNVRDPSTIVFGYGRRICPGRFFAEAAVFITISSVLHTFSISPPLDESGKPIDIVKAVKMSFGVISYPEPFKCVIQPRSAEAEALIRSSCREEDQVPAV
ncbi:cytochrome P450 [Earliella scabrosa]|nr:cytochrome P450 [Earliella scabrosa]